MANRIRKTCHGKKYVYKTDELLQQIQLMRNETYMIKKAMKVMKPFLRSLFDCTLPEKVQLELNNIMRLVLNEEQRKPNGRANQYTSVEKSAIVTTYNEALELGGSAIAGTLAARYGVEVRYIKKWEKELAEGKLKKDITRINPQSSFVRALAAMRADEE